LTKWEWNVRGRTKTGKNWMKKKSKLNKLKKRRTKTAKKPSAIIKHPNIEVLCSSGLAQQDLKHN